MKSILLLSGKRCSGKTTIANSLSIKLGWKHIEMSSVLKGMRSDGSLENMRLRKFVNYMRKKLGYKYYTNYINKVVETPGNLIISGIRHPDEIKIFQDGPYKIYPIYLKCNFFKRLFRAINRNQRSSLIEFVIEEWYSIKWNDSLLRTKSVRLINNNIFNSGERIEKMILEGMNE